MTAEYWDAGLATFADHFRHAESALQYLIAAAGRLDRMGVRCSLMAPRELYPAICSHPSAVLHDQDTGSVAELWVGRVSISAVRLRLQAAVERE